MPNTPVITGLSNARILLNDEPPEEHPDAAEIIDFNADGLPDLYRSRSLASPPTEFDVVFENTGNASFVARSLGQDQSLGLRIQGGNSFVKDVDGNGVADLIAQIGSNEEDLVYKLNMGGAWASEYQSLAIPSGATVENQFTSPDVRSIDLNADKRMDTLRSYYSVGPNGSGVFFAAFLNDGDGNFRHLAKTTQLRIEGIPFTFSDGDGRLIVADFNGDRLADLALLQDAAAGGIRYWPSMGRGKFDDSTAGYLIDYTDGPDLGGDVGLISRLDVSDINGDGLPDLFLILGSRIQYWLNENGQSFGRRNEISIGYDYDPGFATYRVVDLDGDGLQEIVFYAASAPTPAYIPAGFGFVRLLEDQNDYLDDGIDNDSDGFTDEADEANNLPNLLGQITNGIGLVTAIGYVSSAREMIRDELTEPWSVRPPFPVPVVKRIDYFDGVTSNRRELSYRDGYYDGLEKEFRGLGRSFKQSRGMNRNQTCRLDTVLMLETRLNH